MFYAGEGLPGDFKPGWIPNARALMSTDKPPPFWPSTDPGLKRSFEIWWHCCCEGEDTRGYDYDPKESPSP